VHVLADHLGRLGQGVGDLDHHRVADGGEGVEAGRLKVQVPDLHAQVVRPNRVRVVVGAGVGDRLEEVVGCGQDVGPAAGQRHRLRRSGGGEQGLRLALRPADQLTHRQRRLAWHAWLA